MSMKPNADFEKVVSRSGRVILYIQIGEGVLLALAAVAITVLTVLLVTDHRTIGKQQARIEQQQKNISRVTSAQASESNRIRTALCDSQFTIGTAPLISSATKLGIEFVESSRKAFVVLGCPGHLGDPPKELITLGRKLGVPIRY